MRVGVGLARLADLALQQPDPGLLLARRTDPEAGVTLSLAQPAPKRLRPAADLDRHRVRSPPTATRAPRRDRGPSARPARASHRRPPRHGSVPSNFGASRKAKGGAERHRPRPARQAADRPSRRSSRQADSDGAAPRRGLASRADEGTRARRILHHRHEFGTFRRRAAQRRGFARRRRSPSAPRPSAFRGGSARAATRWLGAIPDEASPSRSGPSRQKATRRPGRLTRHAALTPSRCRARASPHHRRSSCRTPMTEPIVRIPAPAGGEIEARQFQLGSRSRPIMPERDDYNLR